MVMAEVEKRGFRMGCGDGEGVGGGGGLNGHRPNGDTEVDGDGERRTGGPRGGRLEDEEEEGGGQVGESGGGIYL